MDASFSTYSTSTPHALVRVSFYPQSDRQAPRAGSLTTAVGSYLKPAPKAVNGCCGWKTLTHRANKRVRPRYFIYPAGRALGFEWDGAVVYQSQRLAAYQAALDDLVAQGRAYPCACTRDIARILQRGIDGCLSCHFTHKGCLRIRSPRAWRLLVPQGDTTVLDALKPQTQAVAHAVGDFDTEAGRLSLTSLAVVVN